MSAGTAASLGMVRQGMSAVVSAGTAASLGMVRQGMSAVMSASTAASLGMVRQGMSAAVSAAATPPCSAAPAARDTAIDGQLGGNLDSWEGLCMH